MHTPRLACLVVPLFPLAARLRSEPELTREALGIFEGNGSAARLVAATRTGRRAGLKPGLTLPQARALLPKLVARSRDADCERSAQEALLEAAETLSPRVEDAGDGVLYVDLAGLERLFSGESFEPRIGRALLEAAERIAMPARVGIAGSKLASRVAADSRGPLTIIPSGEEADFLAPLPLSRLSPQISTAATLRRWGIRSVGELARLSPAEIASRLGTTGRDLHQVARGLDPRPLMPRQPPPTFCEGMSLEWPLVALEPFLFLGRAALERLCRRLETHGLAVQRLGMQLRLEPDGLYERTIDLPAPSHEEKTLLTLVRLELEARPPGAPVQAFTFTAHPDRAREAQLTLFGPAELSPDRLAATLARLFALLGPDRVGTPLPLDRHRPEGFRLEEYAPPAPPPVRQAPPPSRGLWTARVLRPPLPVEVLTTSPEPAMAAGELAEAMPGNHASPAVAALRLLSIGTSNDAGNGAGNGAKDSARRPKVQGRVKVASGPWTLEEEWWTEAAVARDYWDVELADGGVYRLYRERKSGEWFVDGVYD